MDSASAWSTEALKRARSSRAPWCSFDRCTRHSLMTLALNARYSEPSCSRLKPLRCRSTPCAAAAVSAAALWAGGRGAGGSRLHLPRDRRQDLLGVVAQREGAHGGGGGKERAR